MWHTDNAPAAQATRKPDSFLDGKYKISLMLSYFVEELEYQQPGYQMVIFCQKGRFCNSMISQFPCQYRDC